MEPADLRLSELLRIDESNGTIFLHNQRMIVVNAHDLGLLRRELVNTVGMDRARRIFIRFGYARGYRDASVTKEMFGWLSVDDWLRAGARLYALEGRGSIEIVTLRVDQDQKSFEGESIFRNSFEADQHLELFGKNETSVCWVLTGYASGYCSGVTGTRIFFREDSCRGKGDKECHIVGQSADLMTEEARRATEELRSEDFELELRTALAELERQRTHAESLQERVVHLEKALTQQDGGDVMVGVSDAFLAMVDNIARVAATDATVLVLGETGTGKDLVAREIYRRSLRHNRPFLTLNCGALPSALVESELFGYERGAYTGAVQRKLGRFELADGGTLFLDEVGELPLDTQVKFLRVLQQGEFERLGGGQTHRADVRVIAATNRDLGELVEQGRFRADLFYRLNVFPIYVPPLRERIAEITPLVNHFVQKFRMQFRKNITAITRESLDRLQSYSWPGNIRELEHVIERAILLANGEVLTIELSPSKTQAGLPLGKTYAPPEKALLPLSELEREYFERVLRSTGGAIEGKGGAAEVLKLNPSTLRSRLKKLGVLYGTRHRAVRS